MDKMELLLVFQGAIKKFSKNKKVKITLRNSELLINFRFNVQNISW